MVHGKKGFERIVWAAKNVLQDAVTWLFHDFDLKADNEKAGKIARGFPSRESCGKLTRTDNDS